MSVKSFSALALCSAFLAACVVPAAAGRAPNPDERARIEQTLRGAGYVAWDDIELDDGVWEVDDARRANSSRECDLDIRPGTYEIVKEDCD